MRRQISLAATVALLAAGGGLAVAAPMSSAAAPTSARAAATPFVGGTLNALGYGDVDYLDPNVTYYSSGYAVARTFSRQLYSYPAIKGETTHVRPDLATAMPVITNGGKTYKITIRAGADWNTTPARQVTAADVVRGVKTTCNPSTPFGGLPDFESLIKGMTAFCVKFSRISTDPSKIAHFLENTSLPGVTAISDRTVEFTLTHPASYFTGILTLPALSPRPVELDAYDPGTPDEAQHTLSDGPYQVTSYDPTRSIVLNRNPAWLASTDPLRKAYVDEIDISEGHGSGAVQKALTANTPTADVEFDVGPTTPQARAAKSAHDPRLVTTPEFSANPYIVFNTTSPNSHGALKDVDVRRAISFALNRHDLLKSMDGLTFGQPLTHVLPAGIAGSRNFNDYPHSLTKAKSLLAKAGHRHPTLKLLFRADSASSTEVAVAIAKELKRAGITVKLIGTTDFDIYIKYLEVPSFTHAGRWDMSLVGWGPDWYGQAAESFFKPLYDGRALPPLSSNFGLYNSSTVNSLIDRAGRAGTSQADKLWAKADRQVMSDAAIYPIDEPDLVVFHAAQVHNFVPIANMQQGDYTNMWLTQDASS